MQLNKIFINIENIEQDYNPYFQIYANTKEDGVYVNIHNCGWGKAENVNFVFLCFDDNVLDYINKNSVNIYINWNRKKRSHRKKRNLTSVFTAYFVRWKNQTER